MRICRSVLIWYRSLRTIVFSFVGIYYRRRRERLVFLFFRSFFLEWFFCLFWFSRCLCGVFCEFLVWLVVFVCCGFVFDLWSFVFFLCFFCVFVGVFFFFFWLFLDFWIFFFSRRFFFFICCCWSFCRFFFRFFCFCFLSFVLVFNFFFSCL